MDDELPATQPVLPSLLRDVVAYVEVRSGHDNRSRGVTSELRSLGANISTTLSKEVTHVVFQGGHVSTYKKARQMCHVVAVSWIEASKELGSRAPEREHPPLGYEKYEDPEAARRIKVFKSMQPDFDNEKDDERLNKILDRIKKKGIKRLSSTEGDASLTSCQPGKKKNQSVSDKKSKQSHSTALSRSLNCFPIENGTKNGRLEKGLDCLGSNPTNTSGIDVSLKKKINSKKRVKLFTHCGDVARVASSETITVENGVMDYKKKLHKQSSISDKEKNEGTLPLHENSTYTPNKSFDFVVPKPIKNRKGSSPGKQKTATPQSAKQLFLETEKKSGARGRKDTSPLPSIWDIDDTDSRRVQARPLIFIENIPREKEPPTIINKNIDESPQLPVGTFARWTRRSSELACPLMQIQTKSGRKELQSNSCAMKPFVSRVLKALSSRKKPQVILKSPWRRKNAVTVERRQSPRLLAQQNENHSTCDSGESDESDKRICQAKGVQTKTIEPRRKVGYASASAHLFKMLKTKPRKMNSPDALLLDISYGLEKLSEGCDQKSCDSDSDANSNKCNSTSVERTPTAEDVKFLIEALNGELTDGDRSDSPILGTRVKHRLLKSVLSSSRTSTKTPTGAMPLGVIKLQRASNETQRVVSSTDEFSETTKQPKVKKNSEQQVLNECRVREAEEQASITEGRFSGESIGESSRRSRGLLKRSRSGVEKLPTLVCTYLKGSDVKRVITAVRDLGKFEFEEQVSERTTHLVASGPRRTINMLRAVCRGCWILRDEWVYRSVKARKWLPEEDFELTEFSPMVRQRRMLRLSQSGLGQWDLLSSVGPIFVSPASQPDPPDLRDLIILSGGSVAKSAKKAAVLIRPASTFACKKKSVKPNVEPAWLLDCIVKGEELPLPYKSSGEIGETGET